MQHFDFTLFLLLIFRRVIISERFQRASMVQIKYTYEHMSISPRYKLPAGSLQNLNIIMSLQKHWRPRFHMKCWPRICFSFNKACCVVNHFNFMWYRTASCHFRPKGIVQLVILSFCWTTLNTNPVKMKMKIVIIWKTLPSPCTFVLLTLSQRGVICVVFILTFL